MKQQLKLHETRKLHYNKYLYKLVLRNPLNAIFRSELQKNGKLSYARQHIDTLTEKYRNNETLTRKAFRTEIELDVDHYLDAKDIYSLLKTSNSYKIRVAPYMTMIVYTNNRDLLVKIINKMRVSAYEFWEPNEEGIEVLKNNKNVVLVKSKPQFPLRIWFNANKITDGFVTWVECNKDKSRIGDKALEWLRTGGDLNGFYMYVRDERVLNLVVMLAGHAIRRVDKLVYNNNIDK